MSFDLKPGAYRAILKTRDGFGTPVESRFVFLVLDPSAKAFPVRIPFHVASRATSIEPGESFEMLWGTGYERGPVLIEVYQNGRRLQRSWTTGTDTQAVIRFPVGESSRGGFMVSAAIVKDNRLYREERRVYVPWSNKRLELQWRSFRSKLRPGQDETWSLKITGPKAEAKAAEMVAALYDVSLDQFYPHAFPAVAGIFRTDFSFVRSSFSNRPETLRSFLDNLNPSRSYETAVYTQFPEMVTDTLFDFDYGDRRVMMSAEAVPAPMAAMQEAKLESRAAWSGGVIGGVLGDKGGNEPRPPRRPRSISPKSRPGKIWMRRPFSSRIF